jgi:hypothetical protein
MSAFDPKRTCSCTAHVRFWDEAGILKLTFSQCCSTALPALCQRVWLSIRPFLRISAMKQLVFGSLAVIALLVSSQVEALYRQGAFDAVVNAAIYTKVCGGTILANTQKILSGYAQLFRMSDEVDKKLLFAVDFTKRYPDEKATLCSDAKQAVEKLEAQFK